MTAPTFTPGSPHQVFTDQYEIEHRADRNYDRSADGRFLIIKAASPFPPAELSVVLNWTTTLSWRP